MEARSILEGEENLTGQKKKQEEQIEKKKKKKKKKKKIETQTELDC